MYGIYNDLDNSIYQNDSAISRTSIVSFRDSPYKYWAQHLNPNKPQKKSTQAMNFGSAFHALILEHDKFNDLFAVKPEQVYKKDGEEAFEEYKFKMELLKQTQRATITQHEYEILQEMRQALIESDQAWDLIHGAIYEQSFFWEDKNSGLMVKARSDILFPNMIVDLKTCQSACTREYQKSMVEGGYHIQGAMISDAIQTLTGKVIPMVVNICIEKTYPYQIGIKIISKDALKIGQRQYKETLLEMRDCFLTEKWPDYAAEEVDLPPWAC